MTKPAHQASPVPQSRFERLAHLGGLAGRIAGGVFAEGARQFASGKIPRLAEIILTPDTALQVTQKLSQLRGAAMKIGQLLSMDAGDMLPAELAAVLARLRNDAMPMPMSEVTGVLQGALGEHWDQRFKRFSFTPMASASIGQVHRALTASDRQLALKIQYPGIRRSIDSDVDNVATLLRISNLIPADLDIEPLLEEAKRQLQEETDYLLESRHIKRFAVLLGDTPEFLLPGVDEDLTRENILAMDFIDGDAIESLTSADQADRDYVTQMLLQLFFRELFEFGMVQTDPNFANFLYHSPTRQIGLIDFGATRSYSSDLINAYRQLLSASLDNNRKVMAESAEAIGYFREDIHSLQREAVIELFHLATEPARTRGCFDFGTSDLARRIRDAGMSISLDHGYWHTPPMDSIFLHRKLAGLYLLAARLRAKIDLRAMIEPHLQQ